MSNTIAEAHSALKTALADLHEPPYCTGTVPLDNNASTLFYQSESNSDKAEILDFNRVTDSQLAALSQACQPAFFGVSQKDVLDESYRKAGKMEPSAFSTQFSPSSLGIVELIRATLLQGRSAKSIRVELYKLNVYGPGSFFKAHVDTPRSEAMFGSLVIVLPTNHEGGSLNFQHRGREYTFDSAKAVALQENTTSPQVAYVAFYSDVEHEVSIVKSGYRVTLTYNLYWAEDIQPPSDSILINDARDRFKSAFDTLLKNPEFLPKGGFVGFGLAHQYPFATYSSSKAPSKKMSEIKDALKGMDAIFKPICQAFSLDAHLMAVYKTGNDGVYCLVNKFVKFRNEEVDDDSGFFNWLASKYRGKVVYDAAKESPFRRLWLKKEPQPIEWIVPLSKANSFESVFLAYGNQASVGYAYGDACLVARILSAEDRGLVDRHEEEKSEE